MLAVIIALCASFSAIGCAEDEYHPIRVAKEQFGCERILWLDGAHQCNNISGYYLEQGGGKFSRDHVFPQEGGYYVVGEDKSGNEIFVLVPHSDYANSKRYKAAKYDWPFDYSFKEIAMFAGEYGYKYANGIDGLEDEFFSPSSYHLNLCDTEDNVKRGLLELQWFDSVDAIYSRMDVKMFFSFRYKPSESHWNDYYIMQENGKLKMYEFKDNMETNIITYERDAV